MNHASNMTTDHFESLRNASLAFRNVFWAQNAHLTPEQIEQTWQQQCTDLWSAMMETSQSIAQSDSEYTEQTFTGRKRPLERSMSTVARPSKRPELDSDIYRAVDMRRHASAPSGPAPTKQDVDSSPAHIDHESHRIPTVASTDRSYPPSTNRLRHFANHVRNMSVEEYLSTIPEEPCSHSGSVVPSVTLVDTSASMQQTLLLPNSTSGLERYEQLGVPSTAVSEAMTRASTLSSEPMSHSSTNEMICSPLDMLRLSSNASQFQSFSQGSSVGDEFSKPHDVDFFPASFPTNPFSPESPFTSSPEVPMFPSSSFDPSFPCVSSDPPPTQLSSGSLSSVPLVKSRASRRAQEQIAQSSRPIAPKVRKQIVPSPARMVRVSSEDGKVKEVAQIPKTKFQRPTKPKTFCDRCNDQPEGFHGEHELRRHIDRMHSRKRKVWVCKEKDPNGTFLANCKACRRRKTYGANYNAAAHLRRTHFHPCKKGRGGRGKPSEKRGGKGGGDDPPMEELRNWMMEIEEEVGSEGDSPNTSALKTEMMDTPIETEMESPQEIASQWTSHPSYTLGPNANVNDFGAESDVPRYQAMPVMSGQLAQLFESQSNVPFEHMNMTAYMGQGYPTELTFDGVDLS